MSSAQDPNTFIGADNQIADLLAAPILRDARNITWYAAGANNTWLRITKTDGHADILAFKRNSMMHEESELPLEEFAHRFLRPDPADARGLTEDLSRNHYAICQLAMANCDAWDRKDWPMHAATLALLAEHVPSVADVCERAKTIFEGHALSDKGLQYAIGSALHELDAIEALSDDPKGSATLDPWFRTQQLVRVASKAHPEAEGAQRVGLYAFESEEEKSFLLVWREATGVSGGFNMWLNAEMCPLLVDYTKNNEAVHLESPGTVWEYHRPYPGTLTGWSHAMASMAAINDSPFASLKHGAMRALSPQEELAAIAVWAANTTPMADWDDVNNPDALSSLGKWALSTWTRANPKSAQLLQSLLPEIDSAGSPGQLDAWRQLLKVACNPESLTAEKIDLLSIMEP